jgi:DHA3 family tetracycline resistance protein-like MFS transporter
VRRLDVETVWYAYEAVTSFLWMLVFTVTAVYFVTELGMSPFELVVVGTVMELTIFVFEVPTGIVADTYSRRLSIVIGYVVMGIGFVLVAGVEAVWIVLLGYAVWGLGYTFTSGALDAWLGDEVGDERVTRAYLRGAQIGRVGSIAGILAAVGLGVVDLRLPIVLGGLGMILLAVFFALCMPEGGFRRLERGERGSFAQMAHTGRVGLGLVRARPALLAILGIAAFVGMWSESYDRLWQAHVIRDVGLPSLGGFEPIVWFGLFALVGLLLAIAVAQPLERRLSDVGPERLARSLFRLYLVLLGSSLVFALAESLWLVMLASFTPYLARNLAAPIFSAWLNRSIDESSVRATVISITNQADAVGQWTGGPALGAVGNVFGLRAALGAGAACLLPALALFRRAIRHGGSEPALEALAQPAEP